MDDTKLKEYLKPVLEGIFKGKLPLKETLKMGDDVLEGLYSVGYQYNQTGHALRALKYFRLLCFLDPKNPKYSLALAMVLHQQEQYEQAAMMYLVATLYDSRNPIPWFHLSDCYYKLGKHLDAYHSLQHLVSIVDDSPMHQNLKERTLYILKNYESSGLLQSEVDVEEDEVEEDDDDDDDDDDDEFVVYEDEEEEDDEM